MQNKDKKYALGFSMIPQIGAKRGIKILNFFGGFKKAWEAPASDFLMAGIEQKVVDEIVEYRKKIDLDNELERLGEYGVDLITINDKNYPKSLKEIYNPPFLLYIKGEIRPEDDYAIAIVGSRKCSDYGRSVAENIAYELAQNGVTVVSGLAAGIDGFAHKATIEYVSGRTIAVLGCGLDQIYPESNKALAQKIIFGYGAVISEYPLGTPPLKQHFPSRNRIISGLSRGVLVVEATKTSGSLITANMALEQGRDVFAIPGSLYNKNSQGPNSLIKKGAKLIEGVEDILEELDLKNISSKIEIKEIIPESKEEEMIIKFLESEPRHIDDITREIDMNFADLSSLIISMEMKGIVKNIGGSKYIVNR